MKAKLLLFPTKYFAAVKPKPGILGNCSFTYEKIIVTFEYIGKAAFPFWFHLSFEGKDGCRYGGALPVIVELIGSKEIAKDVLIYCECPSFTLYPVKSIAFTLDSLPISIIKDFLAAYNYQAAYRMDSVMDSILYPILEEL
jgi:hypothetical protein